MTAWSGDGTTPPLDLNRRSRSGRPRRCVACILISLYVLVVCPLVLAGAFLWWERQAVNAVAADVGIHAEDLAARMMHEMARYEFLPDVMARNREFLESLTHGQTPSRRDHLNRLVEQLAGAAGAGALFLLDRTGTVVVSSNWNRPSSFVGRNDAQMPYFLAAQGGKPGRYFAAGSAARPPAYTFSRPIADAEGRFVGVAVVQMSFERLASEWTNIDQRVFVADAFGVVFLTNEPAWRYRNVRGLSSERENAPWARNGIDRGGLPLRTVERLSPGVRLIERAAEATPPDAWWNNVVAFADYLAVRKPVRDTGLTLFVLQDMSALPQRIERNMAILGLALVLSVVLAVAYVARRREVAARHAARRDAADRLRRSAAETRAIIDNSHIGLVTVDLEGRIETANPLVQRDFGYSQQDLSGRPFGMLLAEGVRLNLDDLAARPRTETKGRRKDGNTFPLEVSVSPVQAAEGPRFLLNLRDLTEDRKNEAELRIAAEVVENAQEGIVVTAPDTTIISVNPAFCHITGFDPIAVIGQTPKILQSGRHDEAFYRDLWDDLRRHGHWHGEIWNRRSSGEIYPEQLSITALTDEHGEVTGYVGVFCDISQRKNAEQRLERLAHQDALTGLFNRMMLNVQLEQTIAHARRREACIGVLFIDLDGFKAVNDTYGHAIGDILLQKAAWRLKACLREEDFAARLGGDEFVLVLKEMTRASDAEMIAQRVIESLAKPFIVESHTCEVTASVGISVYPKNGDTPKDLIEGADAAMYRAKKAGKNQYRINEGPAQVTPLFRSWAG